MKLEKKSIIHEDINSFGLLKKTLKISDSLQSSSKTSNESNYKKISIQQSLEVNPFDPKRSSDETRSSSVSRIIRIDWEIRRENESLNNELYDVLFVLRQRNRKRIQFANNRFC